jgi:hypothetical protein
MLRQRCLSHLGLRIAIWICRSCWDATEFGSCPPDRMIRDPASCLNDAFAAAAGTYRGVVALPRARSGILRQRLCILKPQRRCDPFIKRNWAIAKYASSLTGISTCVDAKRNRLSLMPTTSAQTRETVDVDETAEDQDLLWRRSTRHPRTPQLIWFGSMITRGFEARFQADPATNLIPA